MPYFFLSYRRSDTEGRYLAHMIYRDLKARFGADHIFLDVDTRSPGLSFQAKILAALKKSSAVLVVIGPQWLAKLNERPSESDDWVKFEVGESLRIAGLPVVPVCHANAKIPTASELPKDLRDLAGRDGITLDPFDGFEQGLRRLIEDLGASPAIAIPKPVPGAEGVPRTIAQSPRGEHHVVHAPAGDAGLTDIDRGKSVLELAKLSLLANGPTLDQSARDRYEVEVSKLASSISRACTRRRPGDIVAGSKLIRPIGAGNFSTIWQAAEVRGGWPSAVKVFDVDKLGLGLMLWRFNRGIRALKLFKDLNQAESRSIVQLREVADDFLSFSMELLPGGDLSVLHQHQWTMQRRLGIFVRVAKAVAFAHANGVIHRDLKPSNIVFNKDGQAVLTDFDIADLRFTDEAPIYSGGGLGTPQFAAPEELVGSPEAARPTCDIFSLGKLLYYLVAERAPPIGCTEPGYSPAYLERFIPVPALRRVIALAIQQSPSNRQQSVDELLGPVQLISDGEA